MHGAFCSAEPGLQQLRGSNAAVLSHFWNVAIHMWGTASFVTLGARSSHDHEIYAASAVGHS